MKEAVRCVGIEKTFYKRKSFGRKEEIVALKGINFTVPQGEIFGLVGQNGSGKSTLIRVLSTLLIPDRGRAFVFGKDVIQKSLEVRRMINRVSVDAALFKELSAWENLRHSGRLYGLSARVVKEKTLAILEKLEFPGERYHDLLKDFSRGMQQKVALARALFTSPMLLLLDEPTTGLDPCSKQDVQAFVRGMQKEHQVTVILTTHDMEEADRLCERVAIIHQGEIIALDTPMNLKEKVAQHRGRNVQVITLEDVFVELTRR